MAKVETDDAEPAELQMQRDEIDERDRIERERIWVEENSKYEAEVTAKAELARIAEAVSVAARLDAMKPDAEKISAFGDVLRLLNYPIATTDEGQMFVWLLKKYIDKLADSCEGFRSW